jgi:hypothetical protein
MNRRRLILPGGIFVLAAVAASYFIAWKTLRDIPVPFVEWDFPSDPLEKKMYDFAHSINLPDSLPKAKPFTFCKKEILNFCLEKATPEEYWQHLCATESGEYVIKSVASVDGLHVIRPRKTEDTDHPTRGEDPLQEILGGLSLGSAKTAYADTFLNPGRDHFEFVDSYYQHEPSDLVPNWRLGRFEWRKATDAAGREAIEKLGSSRILSEDISSSSARYGVLTRGLRRERDREFRIAGTEVIVLDRQTSEVLGVKRIFGLSHLVNRKSYGIFWQTAMTCPAIHKLPLSKFIFKVIQPK